MTEEKNASPLRSIIDEHLKASKQYIESGDYPRVNVQANRIMSDASICREDSSMETLGLVLRLAWFEVGRAIVPRPPKFTLEFPQKQALLGLIDDLMRIAGSVNGADSCAESWISYDKFYSAFWNASRDKAEGRAYSEHPDFSKQVWDWALVKFNEWKDLTRQVRGSPIPGILNELNRISCAHGSDARRHATSGTLQCLCWWHHIILWKYTDKEGKRDNEAAANEIMPYLNRIIAMSKITEDDAFYAEASDLCSVIVRGWRDYFIQYYDLFLATEMTRPPIAEEAIRPPEKMPGKSRARKGDKA